MAQTTVALVALQPNVLKLEAAQLEKLRTDEALIEIHAVGICHAEISCLNGTIPVRFPNVFGHEGSYFR
jgi:Zn-dependent alcohol dehydrogenase